MGFLFYLKLAYRMVNLIMNNYGIIILLECSLYYFKSTNFRGYKLSRNFWNLISRMKKDNAIREA